MKHPIRIVVAVLVTAMLTLLGQVSLPASAESSGTVVFTAEHAQATKWIPRVGTGAAQLSWEDPNLRYTATGYSVRLLRQIEPAKDGQLHVRLTYRAKDQWGIVFRGGVDNQKHLSMLVYKGQGQWVVRELDWSNGWVHFESTNPIISDPLTDGNTYDLTLTFSGPALKVALNGKEFYASERQMLQNLKTKETVEISQISGLVGLGSIGETTVDVASMAFALPSSPEPTPQPSGTPTEPTNPGVAELPAYDKQPLNELRQRWNDNLVGSADDQVANIEAYRTYIAKLDERANALWDDMVKSSPDGKSRSTLFESRANVADKDSYIRFAFGDLLELTKAYVTRGTSLYHNDEVLAELKSGFKHMVQDKGYNGVTYFGNWWPWQIGGAQRFTSALILLKVDGHLSEDEANYYAGIINGYVPTPYKQFKSSSEVTPINFTVDSAGANRIDLAQVVAGIGVLVDDPAKVKQAVEAITPFLEIVEDDNGFRSDGSYIDHESFAYTGGYGAALLKAASTILNVVAGTEYAIAPRTQQMLGQNLAVGVIPNMYRGEVLPSLMGRGLSRPQEADQPWGRDIVYDLVNLSASVDAEDAAKVLSSAKHWISADPEHYYAKATTFADLRAVRRILEDDSVLPSLNAKQGLWMYPQMDRFVAATPHYLFNVGMYSTRVSAYEVGAKENIRGWHFADGMTYLFNGDDVQFHGRYWPTIDPYRLPGTTVDTRPLADDLTSYQQRPSKYADWVGGASAAVAAAVGQQLDKRGYTINDKDAGMDLQAKKSWFVLPGKIVALGADIQGSSTDSGTITTVVENRLLNPALDYALVNTAGEPVKPGEVTDPAVILESRANYEDSKHNIGYVFLDDQHPTFEVTERSGSYKDINQLQGTDEVMKGTYASLLIDHGKEVADGSYAYVLVPNVTREGLAAMATGVKDGSSLKIVENSKRVQAVESVADGTVLANVFAEDGAEFGSKWRAQTPLSMVRQVNSDGSVTYTLADPTQKLHRVALAISDDVAQVLSADEGVNLSKTSDSTTLITVTTEGLRGQSRSLTVRLTGGSEPTVEPSVPVEPTVEPSVPVEPTGFPNPGTSEDPVPSPTSAANGTATNGNRPGSLPVTGGAVAPVLALSALIAAAGIALVLLRRRV